jgi:hypothetical protein
LRTAAYIVSVVFHPLLLTSYLLIILGIYFPVFLSISSSNFKVILSFVFGFTCLLPIVNILMFKYFGTISSFSMQSRYERIVPFLAISVIYLVTTYLFFMKLPISANLNKLIAIVSTLVLVSTLVTFFFKISVHSLAAGGFVGILLPLNKAIENGALLWPTAGLFVVAGIVMSARLLLNAHSPREVYSGAVVGFFIGFAGILLLF